MTRLRRLKYYIAVIVFAFVPLFLLSQNVDSLLQSAEANPDYNTVNQLYETGNNYESYEPETAKKLYLKAEKISRKLNQHEGYCRFAANYTAVLNMQGRYDSSLIINLHALEVAQEINSEEWIAKTKFNIGNCYNNKYLYETALNYYIQVLPYFEKTGNKLYLAQVYDVLQVLYRNMGQYEKSVDYGEKAVALLSNNSESLLAGYILMNLATNYLKLTPPAQQKSFDGLSKALAIAREKKNLSLESSALINFGDYYYKQNKFTEAEKYYRMALPICEKIGNTEGTSIVLRAFSYFELFRKNYDAANQYLTEAFSIATKYNFTDEKRECLGTLAELALMKHDIPLYFRYSRQYDSITTSMQNEMILRNTQDLEIKYQTEKKEIKISSLEKEKRLQMIIASAGIVVLILLIINLYLRQRSINNKKRLAEQEVMRLEQEKQLIATLAVLEGETTERSRLARDLHDGLGGLLTSMKLSLSTMEERVYLDDNGRKMFANALDLLDLSVKELHQVANNMMPESLLNYGLKAAIENFVKNLETKENCNLSFRFFGAENRFMPDFEMSVYRMVQELYNNALKHAAAGEIFLELIIDENRLNISYEDNGKGFNTACLSSGKGLGLSNINTRVKAFGGELEITSAPEKGTQVIIEFSNTNKFLKHDTGSDS